MKFVCVYLEITFPRRIAAHIAFPWEGKKDGEVGKDVLGVM